MSSGWRFRVALGAIVALALALRVLVIATSPDFQPRTDAADYDREAVSLARSNSFPGSIIDPRGGPTASRPPLFPLALGVTYKLSGTASAADRWRAGRVMEALLGSLAVLLMAVIAAGVWDPRTGLVSGLLGAISPPLVLVGSSLMSESLCIPLVLAAVLCALRARSPAQAGQPVTPAGRRAAWIWTAAAGVLVGLTALTRSNGFLLLVPVGLLVLQTGGRRRWRSLALPAVALAATVVTLVPWTARNAHIFGELVPVTTESGYGLAGTYTAVAQARQDFPAMWVPPGADMLSIVHRHPGLNEAQISDQLDSAALHYVAAHPGSVARTSWWNALRMFDLTGPRFERFAARYVAYPIWLTVASVYASWVLLALVLIGLAARAWRGAPAALWAAPLLFLLTAIPLIGDTRYRSPADPFLMMLSAGGLVALARRLPSARSARLPGSSPPLSAR